MRKPQSVKTTIKNDPFGSVIPLSSEPELSKAIEDVPHVAPVISEVRSKPERASRPVSMVRNQDTATKTGKQKLTVHLATELADRVKNAAYWNPRLTIASIAEQGIKYAIEKHERDNGGKYPAREGELVGGRPIK
jgi:hypothetical protein